MTNPCFSLQSQLKRLSKHRDGIKSVNSFLGKNKGSSAELGIDLEKQLQAWRENPSWVNQPPEIKVKIYLEILWFHSQVCCAVSFTLCLEHGFYHRLWFLTLNSQEHGTLLYYFIHNTISHP